MVEVLIAAGILGGLGVVMFQITKDQASQTVRSKVIADMAQFKSQLQALLLNPVHCNANFAQKTTTAAGVPFKPAAFYKCDLLTAGACHTGGNPPAGATAVYPINTTDWVQTNTKITDRIRIKNIEFTIGSVIAKNISNAKIKVDLELRPDVSKNSALPVVKTETVFIDVPVVMNVGVIEGCPRSWNTTLVY